MPGNEEVEADVERETPYGELVRHFTRNRPAVAMDNYETPLDTDYDEQHQQTIQGLNASARNFTSSSTAEIQDDIELQVEMDRIDSMETPLFSALDRGISRVSQAGQKIRTP